MAKSENETLQKWHFCEFCGAVRLAASCTLVISRFMDDKGNEAFFLSKQFVCLDKNNKFVVKYDKNATRFHTLCSLKETGKMLLDLAARFEQEGF